MQSIWETIKTAAFLTASLVILGAIVRIAAKLFMIGWNLL